MISFEQPDPNDSRKHERILAELTKLAPSLVAKALDGVEVRTLPPPCFPETFHVIIEDRPELCLEVMGAGTHELVPAMVVTNLRHGGVLGIKIPIGNTPVVLVDPDGNTFKSKATAQSSFLRFGDGDLSDGTKYTFRALPISTVGTAAE